MRTIVKLFTCAAALSLAIGCYQKNKVTVLEWNKGSVQEQASGTAMWCALMRALSAAEDRTAFKSGDYLAEIFLPDNQRALLKTQDQREWAIKKQPPGMYAYIIARTFFFDQMVERALEENIPQIVILGTGYDSRPYRFHKLARETKFFELDTFPTLQHKKELLQKANIAILNNIIFVPIDFNNDTFEDVFLKAGYDKTKKTLFLWEGVLYYLERSAIDTTLRFIKTNSPPGSSVCFDYMASADGLETDEIERLQELAYFWNKNFPYESATEIIEPYEISNFLSQRGYVVVDHLEAKRSHIQRKFFKIKDVSIGHVPKIFGLVQAAVAP